MFKDFPQISKGFLLLCLKTTIKDWAEVANGMASSLHKQSVNKVCVNKLMIFTFLLFLENSDGKTDSIFGMIDPKLNGALWLNTLTMTVLSHLPLTTGKNYRQLWQCNS